MSDSNHQNKAAAIKQMGIDISKNKLAVSHSHGACARVVAGALYEAGYRKKEQATKIDPPSKPHWFRPALEGFSIGAVIGLAGAWALVEYLA